MQDVDLFGLEHGQEGCNKERLSGSYRADMPPGSGRCAIRRVGELCSVLQQARSPGVSTLSVL